MRGGADLGGCAARTQRTQLEEERAALELRLAGIRVDLDRDEFGDPLGIVTRPVAAERVASSRPRSIGAHEDLTPLFDEIEAHVRDQRRAGIETAGIDRMERTAQARSRS